VRIDLLGDLCIDVNVVAGQARREYGGGVFHGGITASRLGASVRVHTRCAVGDRAGFAELERAGAQLRFLPGLRSTSIRNDYPSDDPDERRSRLLSRAEPFGAADLDPLRCDSLHINPLWAGMFPPALLPLVRERAQQLCADAQGFMRQVQADGSMALTDWPEKERWLPLLDLLKADRQEGLALTGESDPSRAAAALGALGAAAVLLTHAGGLCVWERGRLHEAAFTSCTLQGRTGRGDTCTAAYLVARARMDAASATRFAAEVTSQKMSYRGPFRGNGTDHYRRRCRR